MAPGLLRDVGGVALDLQDPGVALPVPASEGGQDDESRNRPTTATLMVIVIGNIIVVVIEIVTVL